MTAAKRKPGRPPGVTPTVPRVIRLAPDQDAQLVRLSDETGEPIVEIVRRAVAQLLVREIR